MARRSHTSETWVLLRTALVTVTWDTFAFVVVIENLPGFFFFNDDDVSCNPGWPSGHYVV